MTDDLDGVGRPAVAHVLAGPTGVLRPVSVATTAPGGGHVSWVYRFHIPGGEKRAILSFGIQRTNRSEAMSTADRLARLGPLAPFGIAALRGLSAEEQGEILNFFAYPDADLDRLSDADEARLGTDPNNPDSDDDGLTDGFEVSGGLDPLSAGDAHLDPDGDGLDNLGEFAAHTLPNDPDTDDDGLNDGDEVNVHHSNPLVTDTDGDGLTDGAEVHVHHTNPTLADTDGGGRNDGDEVRDGTDPLNAADDFGLRNLPTELQDAEGFRWDVQRNGSIFAGSLAWSGAANLELNGQSFPGFATARTEPGGRELLVGPWLPTTGANAGLKVTRKVFVPTDDTFARYLEIVENPTTEPVLVRLTARSRERGAVQILSTSSGDAAFDRADHWLSLDDDDGGVGDVQPPVALAFAGPGARLSADEATQKPSLTTFAYELRIPAGGKAIVMHFLTQQGERAAATAKAADLTHLRGSARSGLEPDEPAAIVNFFAFADLDFDGLSDADETVAGTDPANPDSDGDGLLDGFESRYGFNPLVAGEQHLDPDGDGLDNLAEQVAGTNPTRPDTDGDGLSDGAEVLSHHTDPLDDDSDEGGRSDSMEINIDGTDPNDGADDFRLASPPTVGTLDGLGFRWVLSGGSGNVSGATTGHPFSSGALLDVASQQVYTFGQPLASGDLRQWLFGPLETPTGLLVSRKFYVPDDAGFARYVETLENPTGAPITTNVDVHTYFANRLTFQTTSSGDDQLDLHDSWAVTDDDDGSGAPAVVHLFAGPGGRLRPIYARTPTSSIDDLQFFYRVTVPPGGKVALLHYLMLRTLRADAATAAADLERLPATALARLTSDDQAAIANFFAYVDSDGDQLSDADEIRLGTDPNRADTDGDGISDGYEVAHGLNPLSAADGALDLDGDGLTNLEEATAHTDVRVADSDGDGLSDGAEVHTYTTDPTRSDTDGDKLADGREVTLGTDPKRLDTDNGGVADGDEVIADGTNPLDPADDSGPIAIDGDLADADPHNPVAVVDRAGDVHLAWFEGASCNNLYYSLRDRNGRAKIGPTQVSGLCVYGDRPALAIDGLGLVHLAWPTNDGGGSTRLWYARLDPSRDDRDGSPADPNVIERVAPRGLPLEPIPSNFTFILDLAPTLVADDQGVAHVAWIERRKELANDGGSNNLDIFHATRISAGDDPTVLDRKLSTTDSWDLAERFGSTLDAGGDLHLAVSARRNAYAPDERTSLWYWLLDGTTNAVRIDATPVVTSDFQPHVASLSAHDNRVTAVYGSSAPGGLQALRLEMEPGLDDRNGNPADPAVLVVSGPTPVAPTPETSPTAIETSLNGVAFDRDGGTYLSYASYDQFDPTANDLLVHAFDANGARILPDLSTRRGGLYEVGGEIRGAATVGGTYYVPWIRTGPDSGSHFMLSVINPDPDGDGLGNLGEEARGTNPQVADTDGDGARDGFEIRYGFNPLSAGDGALDPDGDGLTNAAEDAAGTHPRRADTDGDGLSDGQEVHVLHTDPTVRDTDRDGLSDRDETLRGTDPTRADSDGDGLPDGVEVARGTNPTSPSDGGLDTDGDGASAGEEYAAGTDPNVADTDHDGLSDGDELHLHHTDPRRLDTDDDGLSDGVEIATSATDPKLRDTDGGGRSDGQEVRFDGTDPHVAGDDRPLSHVNEQANAIGPAVQQDALGNSHLTWLGGDCSEVTYSMVAANGTKAIADTELTTDCSLQTAPRTALAPNGTLHMVWPGSNGIRYLAIDPARDDRDGSAADPAVITVVGETGVGNPAGNSDRVDPEVAVGADGRVHFAWVELATRGCCGNREDFDQIHYEQRDSSGAVRLADRAVFDCKGVRRGGQEIVEDPGDHLRSHVDFGSSTRPRLAAAAEGSVHLLFTCEGETDGWGLHELMLDGTTGTVKIDATNLVPSSGQDVGQAAPAMNADGSVTVVFERGPIAREVQLVRFQPALDDRDGSPANPATILTVGPTTLTSDDGAPSDHPNLALVSGGRAVVTFFEHPGLILDIARPRLVVAGANGLPEGPAIDINDGTLLSVQGGERLSVASNGTSAALTWLEYDIDSNLIRLLRFIP
ncbi:MAG: hypothetical protein ABJC13_17740 [Acidobacteriota bacterium]